MEISFRIETDIQIPDHLCNEAALLFQGHLEKYYEEQLSKGENSDLTFQESIQKKNTRKIHLVQLNHLGQKCPLYYKKGKDFRNASQQYQNQI